MVRDWFLLNSTSSPNNLIQNRKNANVKFKASHSKQIVFPLNENFFSKRTCSMDICTFSGIHLARKPLVLTGP